MVNEKFVITNKVRWSIWVGYQSAKNAPSNGI